MKALLIALAATALLGVCFACTSCHSVKQSRSTASACDSALTNAVGDTIAQILLSSGKITVENTSSDYPAESPRTFKLTKCAASVVRFILEDPSNFRSDRPVYGVFKPTVTYTFHASKGRIVKMDCDFGLGKYTLTDANGKTICRYDFGQSDLLRFTHRLFPDDQLLTLTIQSKQK